MLIGPSCHAALCEDQTYVLPIDGATSTSVNDLPSMRIFHYHDCVLIRIGSCHRLHMAFKVVPAVIHAHFAPENFSTARGVRH